MLNQLNGRWRSVLARVFKTECLNGFGRPGGIEDVVFPGAINYCIFVGALCFIVSLIMFHGLDHDFSREYVAKLHVNLICWLCTINDEAPFDKPW